MSLSLSARSDRMIWGYTSNGTFSTRSTYEALSRGAMHNVWPVWNAIWKAPVAQRVRHFLWLACRDRLLTNLERVRRHMAEDAACIKCGLPESTTHVLRDCEMARSIWVELVPRDYWPVFFSQDVSLWLWIKVNTDGALCTASGRGSAGGLARDTYGRWLGGFLMNVGFCSITGAQLWGLYRGLQLAWGLGARHVLMEVDNSSVVAMVSGTEVNLDLHETIIQAIRELLKKEWYVRLAHIYREGNFSADKLASLAAGVSVGFHRLMDPLPKLGHWLNYDLLGVARPRRVLI
ncbi:Polynucleotidyl transferase- ribonuclease H-like superfamily protein [Striga hermonthica]|uniref:Polynucleotidyl transferase- ribonuclease H-like superfamily protein n=1 Tax=Striga hermonthica TaxID=68872 RepID=A0A9N7NF76_STRHE|nr:Polynucleotidyl transferase- ribonuclease H-like superfamily protein [Striga hermonthica]